MRTSEFPSPAEKMRANKAEQPVVVTETPYIDYFTQDPEKILAELSLAEEAAPEAPMNEEQPVVAEEFVAQEVLAPMPEVEQFAEVTNESTIAEQPAELAVEAPLETPVVEHEVAKADLGHVAIQETPTEPEKVEVHVKDDKPEAKPEAPAPLVLEKTAEAEDAIPADVEAEVAAKFTRKDFVKQQEDLFGANDKIKPEDVPEGEMTYEQYLAQRPVAQEGDYYHENGRVHDAVKGTFAKKELYAEKLDNANSIENFNARVDQANIDEAFDLSAVENMVDNESSDRIMRNNVEGAFLVEKDPRLKGLLAIGEDVLALYNNSANGAEFTKEAKATYEAKKAAFDDLYELYSGKELNFQGLSYIADKTAILDDPDHVAVKGSPYVDGEKVDIIDFTETATGNAYLFKKADDSLEALYADDVTFKREFDAPQAPQETEVVEVTQAEEIETAPAEVKLVEEFENDETVEAEKAPTGKERLKNWFSKGIRKVQEMAGTEYYNKKWHDANNWLTTHRHDPNATPEGIQAQKEINRNRFLLGASAVLAVTAIARVAGLDHGSNGEYIASIFNNLSPDVDTSIDISDNSRFGGNVSVNALEHAAGQAEGQGGPEQSLPLLMPDGESVSQSGVNIENGIYNIPDGGNMTDVFHGLGLTDTQLVEHTPELVDLFPNVFSIDPIKGDIRIASDGWLPAEARMKLEEIKNGN